MSGGKAVKRSGGGPEATNWDAFICYSRRDIGFAEQLEQALEAFRAPSSLGVERRRLLIFRDAGDLTGTEYYSAIDKNISAARKMILLCSPDARASSYVDDEIRRFLERREPGDLIPVLVAGTPNNECGPDEDDQKAFPEALCEAFAMPLATDYSDFDPQQNKVQRGRYHDPWYTLLANLYGTQDGTAEGMALAGMYSLMAPLVLLTYAIGLGSSAAVGEEEARSLPILLSSPLRRRSILVAKAAVVVIGVIVVTASMWLGLEVSAAIFGADFSQHDQFSSAIQLIGMVLLFGALSLGVSAATGSSAIGIGVAAGVAVVSYFLTTMLPIVEELADLAKLTPWYLYSGAEALYEGFDPVLLVIAIGIAAVLFAAGAHRLDRRDLKG